MKKFLKFFIITFLFIFTKSVNAASVCSYEEQIELNQKAGNVKVSYDVVEEVVHYTEDTTRKLFEISILNITDDLYVVVKNDADKTVITFTSKDVKDGIAKFRWAYVEDVTNFTFDIYTSNKTKCPNEKYKTLTLSTPRYNKYFNWEVCQGNEDFYLCKEFVTAAKIPQKDVFDQIGKYKQHQINENGEEPESKPTFIDNFIKFVNEYKFYIIGGFVLIGGTSAIIYSKTKKKQRELGL